MSDKTLTEKQIKVLEKGLKFTPTPRRNNTEEMTNDIEAFCRRLRLAEFFLDEECIDESIVSNPSNFVPPRGRNKNLDKFIDYISKFPKDSVDRKKNHLIIQEDQTGRPLKI